MARETSTTDLIGVSPGRMIVRGTFHRCPICGGGHIIRRWFGIVDRCPTCDLAFERIEGHAIGYIGLNTIVTFSTTFVVLLLGTILMAPDVRPWPLIIAAFIPAAVFPVFLLPSCRLAWTAIDLVMRPITPGEIDPRFLRE